MALCTFGLLLLISILEKVLKSNASLSAPPGCCCFITSHPLCEFNQFFNSWVGQKRTVWTLAYTVIKHTQQQHIKHKETQPLIILPSKPFQLNHYYSLTICLSMLLWINQVPFPLSFRVSNCRFLLIQAKSVMIPLWSPWFSWQSSQRARARVKGNRTESRMSSWKCANLGN